MHPNKPELAERLEKDGLAFTLVDGQRLKVSPASALTKTTREQIKAAKSALVDWLLYEQATEPFVEPPGYEGTGWRLAGAESLSAETLARFYEASHALDRLKLH